MGDPSELSCDTAKSIMSVKSRNYESGELATHGIKSKSGEVISAIRRRGGWKIGRAELRARI